MKTKECWTLLVVIAKRKDKEKLVKALFEREVLMMNQSLVKGSAKEGLLRALGFSREVHNVMLSGFIKESQTSEVLALLVDKFNFNAPNSGFAFTIPVESISY